MHSLSLGSLPTPVLFGHFRQNKGWDHKGRRLANHLWVFLTEGSATFRVGELCVDAVRGDAVFIPAGTFYVPYTETACEYYFLHLTGELFPADEADEVPPTSPPTASPFFVSMPAPRGGTLSLPVHRRTGRTAEAIEESLHRCESLLCEHGEAGRLLFALEAYRALALAAQAPPPTLPRAVTAMCAYLAEHAREEITLSVLAEHFGYSASYVARLFRRHLGTTVSEHRNALRLSRAYRLLLDTEMRVGEIAEACGFHDIYYFSRLFKARYGTSPLGARRERGV